VSRNAPRIAFATIAPIATRKDPRALSEVKVRDQITEVKVRDEKKGKSSKRLKHSPRSDREVQRQEAACVC